MMISGNMTSSGIGILIFLLTVGLNPVVKGDWVGQDLGCSFYTNGLDAVGYEVGPSTTKSLVFSIEQCKQTCLPEHKYMGIVTEEVKTGPASVRGWYLRCKCGDSDPGSYVVCVAGHCCAEPCAHDNPAGEWCVNYGGNMLVRRFTEVTTTPAPATTPSPTPAPENTTPIPGPVTPTTTTTTTTTTEKQHDGDTFVQQGHSDSTLAAVGLGILLLVALVVIGLLIWCIVRRGRNEEAPEESGEKSAPPIQPRLSARKSTNERASIYHTPPQPPLAVSPVVLPPTADPGYSDADTVNRGRQVYDPLADTGERVVSGRSSTGGRPLSDSSIRSSAEVVVTGTGKSGGFRIERPPPAPPALGVISDGFDSLQKPPPPPPLPPAVHHHVIADSMSMI